MNGLSWLLYFGDIAENIGFVCGLSLIGIAIFLVVVWIGSAMSDDEMPQWLPKTSKKALSIALAMAIIGTFMPSKKTLYMIAASEMGEKMTKTPEAREIFNLLQERVKDALRETKKS